MLDNLVLRGVIAFVLAVVIDIVWVFYIRATAQGRAALSATTAAGTIMCGAVNGISFVQHPVLILPAALGAFLGTFVVVKRERRRDDEKGVS